MSRVRTVVLLAFLVSVGSACYHATIETGAPPSATIVEKSFASGWVFGLVPPSTIETASQCPNGVARVETQLSFVNQLVGIVTLGIYTPMAIKATCAAGGATSALPADASDVIEVSQSSATGFEDALEAAATQSLEEGRPVYVSYR